MKTSRQDQCQAGYPQEDQNNQRNRAEYQHYQEAQIFENCPHCHQTNKQNSTSNTPSNNPKHSNNPSYPNSPNYPNYPINPNYPKNPNYSNDPIYHMPQHSYHHHNHKLANHPSACTTTTHRHPTYHNYHYLLLLLLPLLLLVVPTEGGILNFDIPNMVEYGSCIQPHTPPNLDLNNFSGVWYPVQEVPSSYVEVKECIKSEYKWNGVEIDVTTLGLDASGHMVGQEVSISQVQPADPTRPRPFLQIRSPNVPPVPYHILATDYQSFACVYSCFEFLGMKVEFFSILSGTPVVPASTMTNCDREFETQGIDTNKMVTVKQGMGCWYSNDSVADSELEGSGAVDSFNRSDQEVSEGSGSLNFFDMLFGPPVDYYDELYDQDSEAVHPEAPRNSYAIIDFGDLDETPPPEVLIVSSAEISEVVDALDFKTLIADVNVNKADSATFDPMRAITEQQRALNILKDQELPSDLTECAPDESSSPSPVYPSFTLLLLLLLSSLAVWRR